MFLRFLFIKIYLFIFLVFSNLYLFAKPIDDNTAKNIAYKFSIRNFSSEINLNDISLVFKSKYLLISNLESRIDYYVFNISSLKTTGFVIVSGDDVVYPILGYSKNGKYDLSNLPENALKWIEDYKYQIRYCIENNIQQTIDIKSKWDDLQNDSELNVRLFSAMSIAPLIQTTWNQSPFYNDLCPFDYTVNKLSVAGCVATAMAQIMKYWNYPKNGSGFKSYSHSSYGTISANFGATEYNWSNMPNDLKSTNMEVARLMFHSGVSVSMNYSPESSGAYVINDSGLNKNSAELAFKQYFGYKASLKGLKRVNFNETQWINILKSELENSRPILYAGFGSGGHAFICDGFDSNNYFHFNWGWGGSFDGYFLVNRLNPLGIGTGGGSGSYNNNQQIVVGIEPESPAPYKLELYNQIVSSQNPISYATSFTISTNIVNKGTGNFIGEFCAALFDTAFKFVDYIEIKKAQNLQANSYYVNGLTFSAIGALQILPGDYYVGIYYRENNGNWVQIKSSGNISNSIKVRISSSSDIELFSKISILPSPFLIKTQPATVNLNVKNFGTSVFKGDYQVNLFNLDGTFVETIDQISESNGLPSNSTYQSPYLNFYTANVKATPGEYLMAVTHKKSVASNWNLSGSSYYSNPIKVTIKNPNITADRFEVNNTMVQAHQFSFTFSDNKAKILTEGSNFHNGFDKDIYKLNLPKGYKYIITARIHDSYNASNGVIYTGDAQFAFSNSSDSSNWSTDYDDIMPNDIVLEDGGIIYFNVWQYFAGTTGDYLLDISVLRYNNQPFNPFLDTILVCSNSITLDAGPGFNDYLWSTGDKSQKILIEESGQYYVSVNNNTPFIKSDTVTIILINNKISQRDTTICIDSFLDLKITKTSSKIYKIGDKGPAGGFIIYDKGLTSNGWRYIEAASEDIGFGKSWWNGSLITTGATYSEIGYSALNSSNIISKQGSGTYAALIARNYRGAGFSDWYLPTIFELRLIYSLLKKSGIGNLNNDFYWSSTEFNSNAAYRINFSNNGVEDAGWKYATNGVIRPIRYFATVDLNKIIWSTGDTVEQIRVRPLNDTKYYVQIQNGSLVCRDSIQISVIDRPKVNFTYNYSCVDIPINFTNTSDTSNSNLLYWNWNFEKNIFSKLSNPIYKFSTANTYPVKLVGTSARCPNLKDSIVKNITISSPIPAIRYNIINTKKDTETSVLARDFGVSYKWRPGNFVLDSLSKSTKAKISKETDFRILITDKAGCTTVDSQLVRVFDKYSVFVPSAFSPDGNGVNDRLKPILVGIKEVKSFRIYSRWGNLIYSTKDVSMGWDGTFNGSNLPVDTYTWVFEGVDEDGKPVMMSGKTTLIR